MTLWALGVGFEVVRAAVLLSAIGLLINQVLIFKGPRDWNWWFITLALSSYIVSFALPVLNHTNVALHFRVLVSSPQINAAIAVTFALAAVIVLQLRLAGGIEHWRFVFGYNAAVLLGLLILEVALV